MGSDFLMNSLRKLEVSIRESGPVLLNDPIYRKEARCHAILYFCFCMFSDYVPLTLDEWILLDAKRRSELSKTQL